MLTIFMLFGSFERWPIQFWRLRTLEVMVLEFLMVPRQYKLRHCQKQSGVSKYVISAQLPTSGSTTFLRPDKFSSDIFRKKHKINQADLL